MFLHGLAPREDGLLGATLTLHVSASSGQTVRDSTTESTEANRMYGSDYQTAHFPTLYTHSSSSQVRATSVKPFGAVHEPGIGVLNGAYRDQMPRTKPSIWLTSPVP
jgi:lipocalin